MLMCVPHTPRSDAFVQDMFESLCRDGSAIPFVAVTSALSRVVTYVGFWPCLRRAWLCPCPCPAVSVSVSMSVCSRLVAHMCMWSASLRCGSQADESWLPGRCCEAVHRGQHEGCDQEGDTAKARAAHRAPSSSGSMSVCVPVCVCRVYFSAL